MVGNEEECKDPALLEKDRIVPTADKLASNVPNQTFILKALWRFGLFMHFAWFKVQILQVRNLTDPLPCFHGTSFWIGLGIDSVVGGSVAVFN